VVPKISVLRKKDVLVPRIRVICACNWKPALVTWKPYNCIYQVLLLENAVFLYPYECHA
jgi:hypothetical protein